MSNLKPLIALLAQTERQRDLALADQTKAHAAAEAAQTQAEQLLAYRREYEQRWSVQFSREGRIELVRCYQAFIERLSQAVEQQARNAHVAKAQLERAMTIARDLEIKLAAVRRVVEQRLADNHRAVQRDDQKQTDELAARVTWNRFARRGQPTLT